MAQRRMFSKVITNSSIFLMMPQSSQSLYFHLGMNADDDGYCEHFTIMRMTESKPDDLKILHAKGLVKVFDDKVLVIKDWKENNYVPKDRYTPSKYLKVYKQGDVAIDSVYTPCIQNVSKVSTQDRLGKDRLDNTYVETQRVFDLFISLFGRNDNIYKLTDKRKLKIRARLKDAGLKMLEEAIRRTSESQFHNGDNERGWKADLDFIIRSYEQVERLSQFEPPAREVQSKRADQFINEIGAA